MVSVANSSEITVKQAGMYIITVNVDGDVKPFKVIKT
jgi:hypothetical protein